MSLKEHFSLWERTSKNGGKYYTGKFNGFNLIAFTNAKHDNYRLPYLRIYVKPDDEGDLQECGRVWYHKAAAKKKAYLSGTFGKASESITGFYNKEATPENKQPAIRFYIDVDEPDEPAEKPAEKKKPAKKTAAAKTPAEADENGDLPF